MSCNSYTPRVHVFYPILLLGKRVRPVVGCGNYESQVRTYTYLL